MNQQQNYLSQREALGAQCIHFGNSAIPASRLSPQVNVTVIVQCQPANENGLSLWANAAKQIEGYAHNKIAREKAARNPLFSNINSWGEYVNALDLDRENKARAERAAKGFWRYYFGT